MAGGTLLAGRDPSPPNVAGQHIGKVSETALLSTVWALFALAALFYVFRIVVRVKVRSSLEYDDAFATLAFVILFTHSLVVTFMASPMYDILKASQLGAAFRPSPEFNERSTFYLKCQFAATCLFWSCLWAVKASFLAFYRKLIGGLSNLIRLWWIMVAVTVCSYIVSIISYPISCTSFQLGTCETPRHIRFSLVSLRMSTALDVITDVLIISLPLSLVAKVRISFRTKLAVAPVFLMGGLVTIFAIVRIIVTNKVSVHPEVSWLNLWSAIECSIAVVVSSSTVIKQLLTHKRDAYGSNNSGSREQRSGGTDGSTGAFRKDYEHMTIDSS